MAITHPHQFEAPTEPKPSSARKAVAAALVSALAISGAGAFVYRLHSGDSAPSRSTTTAEPTDPLADFPGPVVHIEPGTTPPVDAFRQNFSGIVVNGEDQYGKRPTIEDLPTRDLTSVQEILDRSSAFLNFGINNKGDATAFDVAYTDTKHEQDGFEITRNVNGLRTEGEPLATGVFLTVLEEDLDINQYSDGQSFQATQFRFTHGTTDSSLFANQITAHLEPKTVSYDGIQQEIWVPVIEKANGEAVEIGSTR